MSEFTSAITKLPMGNKLLGRPEWQTEAECQDHFELFQSMMDRVVAPESTIKLGQAICRSCVVEPQCHEFAMTEPAVMGMLAGLHGKELTAERKLYKKRRQTRTKKAS